MILRWTARAAKDIDSIEEYLLREATARVVLDQIAKIYGHAEYLTRFPFAARSAELVRGRISLVPGTPYLLHHGIEQEALVIYRVRHGMKKPLQRLPHL